MKAPIIASIIVALAGSIASAAELSVFRVCQDQRVIRTSDGAEAGRVEYIVVDPSDQHVVSTVISGGVVGDRLIAVPYTSLHFNGGNEITLTEITRERLVSAPVIERTQINASVIEPSVIQRTTTHFSARGDMGRERTNIEGGAAVTGRTGNPRANAEAARPGEARPNAEANPNDPKARANAEAASRRDAEARSQAEAQKRTNANDPASAEAAKRGANDPNAATNANQRKQQQQQQLQQQQQSEKAKTDAEAKQKDQQNTDENRKATKPNRDLNNRATPQADREHNENARPQSEAQPGAERKGAADRNASEETPKGRKPAEENAPKGRKPAEENAESSKRPPKKSPEPSAEERSRNDQRNPQL